jgi:spermidine synthase
MRHLHLLACAGKNDCVFFISGTPTGIIPRMQENSMRRYLLFTVFISGMTTLAAELAAGRLLGNVYGTSNIIWSTVIGLILIYLSVGYSIGGRWADVNPSLALMYKILAWGALTLGIVPVIAGPVLTAAANAFDFLQVGMLGASFVAVLILFSVPITLLGMISPFAIRLSLDDPARAGQISGRIYAVSTWGSFLGSFLPTLVTIPALGTRFTFVLFSLLLLGVALVGLARSGGTRQLLPYVWMPMLLVLAAALSSGQAIKQSAGQIYETESAYNYIQVADQNGFTILRLNEGQGVHSIYHPDILQYNGPWDQVLVGPYFYADRQPADVERVAIVGLAAGTTARQLTAVYGDIPIDGFEIDPEIVRVGQEHFGMTMPNLNIIIGDGRWNLEQSPYTYDIIAVDAYRPPYIPPHMTTQEFFQIAADHLTEDGVLTLNSASVPGDRRLINGLATTMGTIFPSIYTVEIPSSLNTMIFATKQPTSAENFAANLVRLSTDPDVHPLLVASMQTAFSSLQSGYEMTTVFTDDHAPIEWIVNDMVIRFILGGGTQYLQ